MPSLKLSNPFRRGADRPSLKERAAALKATAGRVMRRKPCTSAETVAAPISVDWHSPPDGFMAYPVINPQQFIKIEHGLKLEAERLHEIALAELERRREAYRGGCAGRTEADWTAHLRRALCVDELAAAASAGPTADPNPALLRDILAGWSAWAEIDRPGWLGNKTDADALMAKRDALIAAADRLPAALASLPAKTLALAWIEYVDIWERDRPREDYASDGRLALDIHKVAVSAGTSATHPDAALIALGIELEAARARADAAGADYTARADAATAAMPERPACLTFRESDHPFGLTQTCMHPLAMEGLAVDHDDIAWMSRGPLRHQVLRDARPGERGWRDYGGKVPEMEPWPEARARADEIIAAWMDWQAARHAVDVAHAVPAAEKRIEAADAETVAALDRMATLPAHTTEGLRVKLHAIRFGLADMDGARPSARVLRSALRDVGMSEVELEN